MSANKCQVFQLPPDGVLLFNRFGWKDDCYEGGDESEMMSVRSDNH